MEKLVGMMKSAGGYIPLKLEMRLKKCYSSYPGDDGGMIKTDFYTTVIHFPYSITELQEQAKRKQLEPGDIMYIIPAGILSPAIGMPERDELIDGVNHAPRAITNGTAIGDLKSENVKPVQHFDIDTDKIDEINRLRREIIQGWGQQAIKDFNKEIRKTWGLGTIKEISEVLSDKADDIIRWLRTRLVANQNKCAASDGSFQEWVDDPAPLKFEDIDLSEDPDLNKA